MTRLGPRPPFRCPRPLPAAPVRANPASEALRAKAANHTYNLEHDLALATFRQAVAADPEDAGAYRGVASALWLWITFRRGNMTVDDYLGRPNKPNTTPLPPPPPKRSPGFAKPSKGRLRSRASALPRTRRTRTHTISSAPQSGCARPTPRRSTAA